MISNYSLLNPEHFTSTGMDGFENPSAQGLPADFRIRTTAPKKQTIYRFFNTSTSANADIEVIL